MKTTVFLAVCLCGLAVAGGGLGGCEDEGAGERAGRKLDEAGENLGKAVENVGEAVQEAAKPSPAPEP